MGMLLPQEVHHVNTSFDARIYPSSELVYTTILLCLLTRHLQDTLCHNYLPIFAHPHGPHFWVLVVENQATGHERAV